MSDEPSLSHSDAEPERSMTAYEAELLRRLIGGSTMARRELEAQFDAGITAEGELRAGVDFCSIVLRADNGPAARAADGNPVTAVAADDDGVPIVIQLLVAGGRLCELAVFKADGTLIRSLPAPRAVRVHDTHEFEEGKVQHLPP